KKKVFFYWGEEWVKYHFLESGSSVGSAGLLTVPTLKMRSGDFSELLDPNNPFVTRKDASGNKIPVLIKDPQSANACTVADQTGCFPGNIIPSNQLSPNGIGFLNACPIHDHTNFISSNGVWITAKIHNFDHRTDT